MSAQRNGILAVKFDGNRHMELCIKLLQRTAGIFKNASEIVGKRLQAAWMRGRNSREPWKSRPGLSLVCGSREVEDVICDFGDLQAISFIRLQHKRCDLFYNVNFWKRTDF